MGFGDRLRPVPETARVDALERLRVREWEDPVLAEPVALAQSGLALPVAQLGLVGEAFAHYPVSLGLAVMELPRRVAFCAHVVKANAPFVVHDALADPRFHDNPLVAHEPWVRFYAGHPVHAEGGEPVGTLCVMDFAPREWSAREAAILEGAAHFATALVRLRSRESSHHATLEELARSRDLALRDPLTWTWNRHGAMQLLERARARAARRREPLTVMRVGFDDAGDFADRYGRHSMDAVVCEAAARLKSALRAYDVLGRSAETEFLVGVGDANPEQSRAVSQRLVALVGAQPYEVAGGLREVGVTAGAAFCDFKSHAFTAAALAVHASHALKDARAQAIPLDWRELG